MGISDDDHLVRDRVTRLFKFVHALHALRNPTQRQIRELEWTMPLDNLPLHPSITLIPPLPQAAPDAAVEETSVSEVLLRVERAMVNPVPPPPAILAAWVVDGWQDQEKSASVKPERLIDGGAEPRTEAFADDPARVAAFEEWEHARALFIEAERPAREALAIFERLYVLRGIMEREAERFEILLGEGILCWRVPSGAIRFPLVLQRLELEFDPSVPAFTLSDAESSTELNGGLLRAVEGVDGATVGVIEAELTKGQYHPLTGEAMTGFLKSLPPRLAADGRFLDEPLAGEPGHGPVLYRAPLLFLRKRTFGFTTSLENILKDLAALGEIPQSLQNITGSGAFGPAVEIASEPGAELAADVEGHEDILFTMPANEEQVRIAQTLMSHKCVLCQGPPGTGKSHTIANIVGHCLAQGKSILITSSTTKALRVLREKIVPELQALCVSVLESDAQSSDQLKSSVHGIVGRLEKENEATLATLARASESFRDDAMMAMNTARQQLIAARQRDHGPVLIAGDSYDPIQAAKVVFEGESAHAWIPGPLKAQAALNLTVEDVRALYRTNATVSPEIEQQLGLRLPDPTQLPIPHTFSTLITDLNTLASPARSHQEYWKPSRENAAGIEMLVERLPGVLGIWLDADDWLYAVGADGYRAKGYAQAWESLFDEVEALETLAEESRELLLRLGPALASDMDVSEQQLLLGEIVAHLHNGGKFDFLTRLTKGRWKAVIANTTVGARPPRSLEEYRALHALASLELGRRALIARWERQVVAIGGPTLPPVDPEELAGSLARTMRVALAWYHQTFAPYNADLSAAGFLWTEVLQLIPSDIDARSEFGGIVRSYLAIVPVALESRAAALRRHAREQQLDAVLASLEPFVGEIADRLRNAVRSRSPEEFAVAYAELARIHALAAELETRHRLLAKLAYVAPAWTEAIRRRLQPHDESEPPGDVAAAWRWRQLAEQLDEREKTSLEDLDRAYQRRLSKLQEATVQLVDAKAWLAQRRRTGLSEQQSLMGWLTAVKKIGKGFGKRVPVLRKAARALMGQAKSAVPVWIMPLIRVAENYDPRTTKFDVVIMDEASQSDVTGLIALYYGRQVVIVGDDEQVSPDAIGQTVEEVQSLVDEFLYGIPNDKLYDGKISIYDLAKASFGGIISLREHFRCVPDIIAFSNNLSYDNKMVPLREASQSALLPHVVPHRVVGVSDDRVNKEEALEVVALLMACLEQSEYHGKTFGVISLMGEEQARLIETLLRQQLEPAVIEARRILCGNAPQFQGDERDVMFLSMVDAPRGAPQPMRDQANFQKRFNVAASRARDQMWLVYSLNPATDLQAGDLRRRLIEHCLNPHALTAKIAIETKKADSDFERDVLRRLISAGYQATSQYRVGAYRIDIMVEDASRRRLAVECDGEQFHTIMELEKDLARQGLLERVGLTFHRIRGGKYYRNPDREFARLVDHLRALDIAPIAAESPTEPSADASELKQRVVARAQEIRTDLGITHDLSFYRARRGAASTERGLPASAPRAGASGASTPRPACGSENGPANSPSASVPSANGGGFRAMPPISAPQPSAARQASLLPAALVPRAASGSAPEIVERLRSYGFELAAIVDHRDGDRGSLWVIADASHRLFFESLRLEGIRFDFALHGGRATQHQPAWYSRSIG